VNKALFSFARLSPGTHRITPIGLDCCVFLMEIIKERGCL